MFIRPKIAYFFEPRSRASSLRGKLLKYPAAKFGWWRVGAVILFVFGLNFGLVSQALPSFAKQNLGGQAKTLSSAFLGGLGGGGTDEVVNGNSANSAFLDNSSVNSLSCFLDSRLTYPQFFSDGEWSSEIVSPTLGEDTFFGYYSPLTTLSSGNTRNDVITHIVTMGENPWTIAAYYGISANTVLWANKLSSWQYVKVDQELIILPVSGVRHKVIKGDTVEKIAKKYRTETGKIIAFNNLPAIGTLEEGEYLVVPDGEMPPPPQPIYVPQNYTTFAGDARRAYAAGQCTWYVAQKRTDIPTNWSHAKNWLRNALAAGYAVCQGKDCTPQKGAIISLADTGWLARLYGHVAYIEEINGDQITISEMNHLGKYKITQRTLNIGDGKIKGYIY